MRTFRRLMIVIVAIVALAAATPAFAQNTPPPIDPAVAPQTQAPAPQPRNEAGFGIGAQFGWLRSSNYSSGTPTSGLSTGMPGYLIGLWMGGNKGGAFGFGADINYVVKGATDVDLVNFDDGIFVFGGDLKLHYIEIPVMARINIGSRTTNGAAFYVLFGPVIDILLKGQINSLDVKSQFNGFDLGAVAGAGFEVARIGVEARGNWAFRTLQSTGGGTFLNGLEDSKAFTFVILAKIRFN